MSQSKRFIIVSFFVTLTLSALCQSSYAVIKAFAEHLTLLWGLRIMYVIGLACFLIKYFIDDVVDDNGGKGETISRRSLSALIIGWMFFLFAALSAENLHVSSFFWLIGIVVITWFMIHNKASIPAKCFWRYLGANLLLGVVLLGLTMPMFFKEMAEWGSFLTLFVTILFMINVGAFVVMLSDGTPEIRG